MGLFSLSFNGELGDIDKKPKARAISSNFRPYAFSLSQESEKAIS